MIKLLAMLPFIIVGAFVGFIFHRVVHRMNINSGLTLPFCIVLGIFGAFAGILLADFADLRFIGNIVDGLMFATVGSTLLLSLNLLIHRN